MEYIVLIDYKPESRLKHTYTEFTSKSSAREYVDEILHPHSYHRDIVRARIIKGKLVDDRSNPNLLD